MNRPMNTMTESPATPSSVADRPDLDAVRRYWEWYMARTHVPGEEFGSKGYFDTIKAGHEKAYSIANDLLDLTRVKGRKLLELGCGIGLDTVEFARSGAEVTAIDTSPMALSMAESNLRHNGQRAHLLIGDAEHLEFPDDSFDLVVARGIMMFTPDDSRVACELSRVLKPGGEAQVLLHKRVSWYTALARLSGANLVHEDGDPPINRLYSVSQAKAMLLGFSSVRVSFGRLPYETRRAGGFATLFNRVLMPLTRLIPTPLVARFGYYMIVRAVK